MLPRTACGEPTVRGRSQIAGKNEKKGWGASVLGFACGKEKYKKGVLPWKTKNFGRASFRLSSASSRRLWPLWALPAAWGECERMKDQKRVWALCTTSTLFCFTMNSWAIHGNSLYIKHIHFLRCFYASRDERKCFRFRKHLDVIYAFLIQHTPEIRHHHKKMILRNWWQRWQRE